MKLETLAALARPSDRKVLLLVLDGLGGLPMTAGGPTALEAARTPNLDELARAGTCGLHEPVGPGITPGSGPGHLALFGYDPLVYETGRGVLEALGIEFPLGAADIAIRANFCTVDDAGRVVDRRAGRISTEEAAPLAERLDAIEMEGAACFVRHVKEHRFVIVLRPEVIGAADVDDTDPGRTGEKPLDPQPRNEASVAAAELMRTWVSHAREVLSDQPIANMALLRGASIRPDWPSFEEAFGMRGVAIAAYPMYRGVASLVGMSTRAVPDGAASLAPAYREEFGAFDFAFLHFKAPDKAGEDGDFDRKVAVIEEADAAVPDLMDVGPDVVVVTGDHSTPALLKSHSWHPVPFLVHGGPARADATDRFGETACLAGSHGLRRGCHLMPIAAAHAGRLDKFGA